MANWAYNTIVVEGKAELVKTVYGLLNNYSEDIDKGHSPLEQQSENWDRVFMFNISFDFEIISKDAEDFTFHCESKYVLPESTLKYLSDIFGLKITAHCINLSDNIYSETYISNGEILATIRVDPDEFLEDEEIEEKGINEHEHYEKVMNTKKSHLIKMLA